MYNLHASSLAQIEPKEHLKYWGISKNVIKTTDYMGNVNFYRAGKDGSLQVHPRKDETLHLFSGEAVLWTGCRKTKKLFPFEFHSGETYHIPPGVVHKFQAVTDCVVFEISTPIENDRENVEDEFKNSIG